MSAQDVANDPGPTASSPLPADEHYRPHLDGLRTVAVVLVVAFHAGLGLLAGGFVGVDIFFVLSGFLVTGILHSCDDLASSNRFKFANAFGGCRRAVTLMRSCGRRRGG